MFWRTLALSLVFLLTTPRVVHAGNLTKGLYLAGVSTSLLIFQNGTFGADAALSKLRKFFKRGTKTEGDEESEEMLPEKPTEATLPKNVKKAYNAAVSVWLEVLFPEDNSHFVRHLRETNRAENEYGEEAVREILRLRNPGPDRPHPLDEIFPVGGEMKFLSRYNKERYNIKRVARTGTELPVCNVMYPMLDGEVSIHMLEFPEDMLKNPESLEAALHLVHQRVEPPVVGDSPAKRQKQLGLLTVLDMFTMLSKSRMVPGVYSPGKIFFNMFLVTSAVKCSLRELLLDLEKCSSDDEIKRTAHRAKLSVTLQMITILSKIADLGLVLPPVTTGSFVLNSVGKVFLSDFAPLLQRGKRYVQLPSGLIVPEKKTKRAEGDERGTPYRINDKQVTNDLVSMILEMWCRRRDSGGHSDTIATAAAGVGDGGAAGSDSEKGAAAAGGATGRDSEEGAAAAAAPTLSLEDFDCGLMPTPMLRIVEMLLESRGAELGRIITHHQFLKLMANLGSEEADV